MDKEILQLLMQVMYAPFPRNQRAATELKEQGIPESVLADWKRRGMFKKRAAILHPSDRVRVIQVEAISEPSFVRRQRQRNAPPFS